MNRSFGFFGGGRGFSFKSELSKTSDSILDIAFIEFLVNSSKSLFLGIIFIILVSLQLLKAHGHKLGIKFILIFVNQNFLSIV